MNQRIMNQRIADSPSPIRDSCIRGPIRVFVASFVDGSPRQHQRIAYRFPVSRDLQARPGEIVHPHPHRVFAVRHILRQQHPVAVGDPRSRLPSRRERETAARFAVRLRDQRAFRVHQMDEDLIPLFRHPLGAPKQRQRDNVAGTVDPFGQRVTL